MEYPDPWQNRQKWQIKTLPLSSETVYKQVEEFLLEHTNLKLTALDYCAGLFIDEELLAIGGFLDNTIMNLAVAKSARGKGLMQFLLEHLQAELKIRGFAHLFIYTTPENEKIIKSLGFHLLYGNRQYIFAENRFWGISSFGRNLAQQTAEAEGVALVVNANPFTYGHLHLVEQALKIKDRVRILLVETDKSYFPFSERLQMLKEGVKHLKGVSVFAGGPYTLAAGVFPDYFLKQSGEQTKLQAELDCHLFGRYLGPALNCSIRLFGQEPLDVTTAQYVQAAQNILPQYDIEVRIIPRLAYRDQIISASRVRALYKEGNFLQLENLVPPSTFKFLQEKHGGAC
ncbi:MAG: GNAT family N-acetyltransferase [Firmicutes bacterium]|jgi:[citrate (pro-3S)-lyase] ligase|nr:GNAT family N-acetyltransferase [Bacillota bacterium]